MWLHNGVGWGGWIVISLIVVAAWSLVVLAMIAIFRSDRDVRQDQAPVERDPLGSSAKGSLVARSTLTNTPPVRTRSALHAEHATTEGRGDAP